MATGGETGYEDIFVNNAQDWRQDLTGGGRRGEQSLIPSAM